MWRPDDWPKCPCDDCERKEDDKYGRLCDLACGKYSAYLNREVGANAMQKALIKWIKSHELTEYCPDEGDSFNAYLLPVKELPSVETE